MKQDHYFAKQEDHFSSFNALFSHLNQLQRLQQENILAGIRRRQERRFKPVRAGALNRLPVMQDWLDYGVDFSQRSVLFWDTLRQRGDDTLAHQREGFPILLKFDYEVIVNGSELPTPVNYCLLRILPGGQSIDESLPPLIVIDPRGGHGAGIGGFKEDSAIGESLRAGHATYFIAFSHAPEPGQTLDDIASAQAHFLEIVSARHPDAGKPVVIGNCQAGWALMGLAALRPELPGLVIINGAPLSYWAGVSGRNPMRYTGGLFGGGWMTRLGSDLGNGRFDGAWLVNNFENLDPANTYCAKYYNLFTHIDTEPKRFLDFERWWGSPVLFNQAEIESVVDDLFIGNSLSGNNPRKGAWVDLRRIEAPVVVFCSSGDNITPPQQALNWIADIYPTDLSLHSAGRTIVYLKHATIGHLGIFVSGKVARREHRELIGAVEAIQALPPGLYELVIDDLSGEGKAGFSPKVHFERRGIADILSHDDDGRDDEREFALVDRVSEINSSLYDWTIRPWMRQMINEPIASLLRQAHPFRQERVLWSSLNPALWWLPASAATARRTRKPVPRENPLLAWQDFWAASFEHTLDAWRDIRDAAQEMAFHAVYGGLSTLAGTARTSQTSKRGSHNDQALVERLREALPNGGRMDATLRILLLLANASGRLNKDTLTGLLADCREASVVDEEDFAIATLREIAYLQNMLVFAYPQESLDTLPMLLPTLADRQAVLEAVRRMEPQWLLGDGPVGELWRGIFERLELPVADFALREAAEEEQPPSVQAGSETEVDVEAEVEQQPVLDDVEPQADSTLPAEPELASESQQQPAQTELQAQPEQAQEPDDEPRPTETGDGDQAQDQSASAAELASELSAVAVGEAPEAELDPIAEALHGEAPRLALEASAEAVEAALDHPQSSEPLEVNLPAEAQQAHVSKSPRRTANAHKGVPAKPRKTRAPKPAKPE
jgi:pimeloyl-ACP methyl ester carboxylesterase